MGSRIQDVASLGAFWQPVKREASICGGCRKPCWCSTICLYSKGSQKEKLKTYEQVCVTVGHDTWWMKSTRDADHTGIQGKGVRYQEKCVLIQEFQGVVL